MNSSTIKKLVQRNRLAGFMLSPAVHVRRRFIHERRQREVDVLDKLVQSLAADPIVSIESFKGVFALDSRSHLFKRTVLDGGYESELLEAISPWLDPDKDAIDVGANVGLYSVLFAKTLNNGQVLAIEPTANAGMRLRRNIEMNGVATKVDIFEGVASNAPGTVRIQVIAGKEEYSSIGAMSHPSIANESSVVEEVPATTVDALVRSRSLKPGFMKVDVEGAEHLVFDGSREVLSKHRPVVLSELSDTLLRANGSSALDVIRMFEDLGYTVIDPLDRDSKPGTKGFGDILCLPGS